MLKNVENNEEGYHTPKNQEEGKVKVSGYVSRSRETLRKKMENDRSRDSVEILKEMASHKADKFRSPKFKYDREEG